MKRLNLQLKLTFNRIVKSNGEEEKNIPIFFHYLIYRYDWKAEAIIKV